MSHFFDRNSASPPEFTTVSECDICNRELYEKENYYYDENLDLIICESVDCLSDWAEEQLYYKEMPTLKEIKDNNELLKAECYSLNYPV